ncbi:TetR/AcrR family transcriptional regulator [Actinoplanes sp. DH11]|uniref:TetR/AcrR family transcriptional regulator n=1 Tax=Actinoplanes sp. DH11 TaxID=2857011 RepID=UPI001E311B78|nr:TetR/AcrR family transcriptional regulator [Actinoplanes sp. DH11]
MSKQESLWTRSRQAVYAEITSVAMKLFLEQGFEQTTIDQIAATAAISRRSFFRYFGTKEDIVLGDLASQGILMRDTLEAIPLSVAPWEAIREALRRVGGLTQEPDVMLKVAKMMYETPSLRARSIEKHLQWQELLVPNIRLRLGLDADDRRDPAADAIVSSAIACLDVAGQIWTRTGGTADLADLYDRAVLAVRAPDDRTA